MKHFLIVIPLWLGLTGLLGAEAVAQTKGNPLAVVPAKSVAVLKVNWASLSKDSFLRAAIKGDEIEKALRAARLDPATITELAVFSDLAEPTHLSGIVVHGTYDQAVTLERLTAQRKASHVFQNHKIYRIDSEGSFAAGLRAGLIVLGTKDGVEGAIESDLKPSATLAIQPAWRRLTGKFAANQSPITMMMVLPDTYQDLGAAVMLVSKALLDLAGLGPVAEILDKIGLAQGFGLTLTHNDGGVPVELVAIMADDQAAATVSGALNLLKGLTAMAARGKVPHAEEAALRMMQQMSISRERELLTIKLALPETALRQ